MLQADNLAMHPRTAGSAMSFGRDLAAASPVSSAALQFSIEHDLDGLAAEWRRFEQHADCTAFQAFDWLAAWQTHIGALAHTVPAIVTGRKRSGELAFILPLAVQPGRFARQLVFLGRDLGDYNAPLLARDFPRLNVDFLELWARICGELQSDPRTRHDLVMLDKMPAKVGAQANPMLALDVAANPSGAYLTPLVGTWDAFYAGKRSSAVRRRERTKRRRLGEMGEVRMVSPGEPAAIVETLATLMDQKSRAFARMGVGDIFARPGYRAFFMALTGTSETRALLHISRLEVGSTWAATNLGLTFRGVYYHVLASYDEGPTSRFGAGAEHLRELLQYAIHNGFHTFDFTIGDEPYKRQWCDVETQLFDHLAAASVRGRLIASVLSILRRTKRAIKQSPVLWPLVQRLRAAFGSEAKPASEAAPADGAEQPDNEKVS